MWRRSWSSIVSCGPKLKVRHVQIWLVGLPGWGGGGPVTEVSLSSYRMRSMHFLDGQGRSICVPLGCWWRSSFCFVAAAIYIQMKPDIQLAAAVKQSKTVYRPRSSPILLKIQFNFIYISPNHNTMILPYAVRFKTLENPRNPILSNTHT